MQTHNITLVGAGPGDPKLLTLAAVEALAQAEVVLYDALSNPEILKHCAVDAELVFVGKRKGKACSQNQICEWLLHYAQQNKRIVRLKGGDPFVFGRGGEEARYLAAYGYECQVIPGVSSFISVPELAGISLSDRLFSHSFGVVSAHRKDDGGFNDEALERALKGLDNLVVLMAKSRIREVCSLALNHGWQAADSCALIVDGSLPSAQGWRGTIADFMHQEIPNLPEGPGMLILGNATLAQNQIPMAIKCQWQVYSIQS